MKAASPAKPFSANGETLLSGLSHCRGPPQTVVSIDAPWFHLLWMFPVAWLLGSFSVTLPLRLLWIPSHFYGFLCCLGLPDTKPQKLTLHVLNYWFVPPLAGDDATAQFKLGVLHHSGRGVTPQDYGEAAKWFRKAAEQGHSEAQFNLGQMYDQGQGVPQDFGEAAKWFRKAAEQGLSWAQNNLGVMYREGEGVPQDYPEAAKWFSEAAEQGHTDAQYNLGVAWSRGEGVPQDDTEAATWFRKAAEQGHADAQRQLVL